MRLSRAPRLYLFSSPPRDLNLALSLALFFRFRPSGKSSLTVQFVDQHFVDSYYPTIENTFQKVVKYKGQEFNLDIIDTAGQVSATFSRLDVHAARRCADSMPFVPG